MFTRELVLTVGLSSLAFACADQPSDTQETIDNLVAAGYPADEIMVVDGVVYVGNDAVVTLDASREMARAGTPGHEQYRSENLIAPDIKTICLDDSFEGMMSKALDHAVESYNALGLDWRLLRRMGGAQPAAAAASCDASIAMVAGDTSSSGYPSAGRPFRSIIIDRDIRDLQTMGYVIVHQIGHTTGIRHSDFFNRAISCGTNPDAGDPEQDVGAILIPGTPEGARPGGSIFNTCAREQGESDQFRPSDVAALRAIY